jgi:hypothetical protein
MYWIRGELIHPEHSKAIYGKVLPIHIERNQARSDGLTD